MNYKNLGLKAFSRGEFELAKLYFSLAYEKSGEEEILFLLELCQTALADREEALMLFDFYNLSPKTQTAELFKILNSINEKIANEAAPEPGAEDEIAVIAYADFMRAVDQRGFKDAFESIIFSSKIAISDKSEMIEFLENLIENGYYEMGLNYVESSAAAYAGDERFEALMQKIKNHENTTRK